MNVLMISPAYPAEMPLFTRGLAAVGANVIGVSDLPTEALPREVRQALSAHIRVPSLLGDEAGAVAEIRRDVGRRRIDRVECLWEPGMILAARIRETLGVPGLNVAETLPYRDKENMKLALDSKGIRTPHHARARSDGECREAANRIGYPLIVKPIAGGGSADTHRIENAHELESALARLGHVPEVSVEEFIDGEELTYDTVCADGEILYDNIAWYRPRPLLEKLHEQLSPQVISLRRIDAPELGGGREMGRRVLAALGYQSGFTHMEWFLKSDGEVVFGEIGARPPGARVVDTMNYACDLDLYTGWAESVCHGRISQRVNRRYNAAMISKRARGRGRIRSVEGLERLRSELGSAIVCENLLPIGSPRRDWKMTSIGDGYLILRHPELQQTIRMADRVARELHLHAG